MNMKKLWAPLLSVLIAFILTGCFEGSAEDLYRLPQPSERYVQIQSAIDDLQKSGMEYAAPSSGYNRQSVQLNDIDSDGEEEVFVFMRSSDEKPLKVYLLKNDGVEYRVVSLIEGDGTNIDSVAFVDMDGDGTSEVLLGWQLSSSVKLLSIYSVKDYIPVQLSSGAYSAYTTADITGDGQTDVVLLRAASAEAGGSAVLCRLMNDGEITFSEALLSQKAEMISRLQTGLLSDGKQGVYVDSICGSGLITDVLAFKNDELRNISLADDLQNSDTARPYSVYSSDLDGDGVVEIPCPVPLYQQSETVYYVIRWMVTTVRGFQTEKLVTYHNYSDGWYLILKDIDPSSFTVRRADRVSGERTVVFSLLSGDMDNPVITDILTVYTLTGDNKEDRAGAEGRFLIYNGSNKLFAATIDANGQSLFSEESVKESFSVIYSDWLMGNG